MVISNFVITLFEPLDFEPCTLPLEYINYYSFFLVSNDYATLAKCCSLKPSLNVNYKSYKGHFDKETDKTKMIQLQAHINLNTMRKKDGKYFKLFFGLSLI